jgi:hypothetical protein
MAAPKRIELEIEVPPSANLRGMFSRRSARATAESFPLMTVQGTTISWLRSSDHWKTAIAILPVLPWAMA